MIKVIFIGSGAVAAEVCSYIEDINKIKSKEISILGFLDDNAENYKKHSSNYKFDSEYLGKIDDWSFSDNYHYVFGFANLEVRERLIKKLDLLSLNWLTIIHPSAQVSNSAIIEQGTVVYPNCVVGPNAKIGRFNLITSFSFVSHDCEVGDNNFLSTSGLSGNVKIGNNNFFGIRTTILPSIQIGSNNIFQAGMTIDKNVSDNETVYYRFKEKVSFIKS
jgi:sugar O-acyltransferase (sialic acid O-acetyltransferase NeuD family)